MIVCPRCNATHDITPTPLRNPIIDPHPSDKEHPCTYHEWAICPTTGEPILFQHRELDEVPLAVAPPREEVARLAYAIWEAEGRPDGKQEEHWRMAEYTLTRVWRFPAFARLERRFDRQELERVSTRLTAVREAKVLAMLEEE